MTTGSSDLERDCHTLVLLNTEIPDLERDWIPGKMRTPDPERDWAIVLIYLTPIGHLLVPENNMIAGRRTEIRDIGLNNMVDAGMLDPERD